MSSDGSSPVLVIFEEFWAFLALFPLPFDIYSRPNGCFGTLGFRSREVENAYLRSDQEPGYLRGGAGTHRPADRRSHGGAQHRRRAGAAQWPAGRNFFGARPHEARGGERTRSALDLHG